MTKNKRIVATALAVVLTVSMFAGCGKKDKNDPTTAPTQPENTTPSAMVTETVETLPVEETEMAEQDSYAAHVLKVLKERAVLRVNTQTEDVDIADAEKMKMYVGLQDMTYVNSVAVQESTESNTRYAAVLIHTKGATEHDLARMAEEIASMYRNSNWLDLDAENIQVSIANDCILVVLMDYEVSNTMNARSMAAKFQSLMNSGAFEGKDLDDGEYMPSPVNTEAAKSNG